MEQLRRGLRSRTKDLCFPLQDLEFNARLDAEASTLL